MYLDFAEMKMHMVSAYFDFTILVQKLIHFLFQTNMSTSVDVMESNFMSMEQKMQDFETKLSNVTSGSTNTTGLQNQIVRHFIEFLLWIHCIFILLLFLGYFAFWNSEQSYQHWWTIVTSWCKSFQNRTKHFYNLRW